MRSVFFTWPIIDSAIHWGSWIWIKTGVLSVGEKKVWFGDMLSVKFLQENVHISG